MTSTKTPNLKVILCGEYGVGKSSIFRRFGYNTFLSPSNRQSTLGLDHFSKAYAIDGKDIKLQLWDTGGMERVASITSSYYKFSEAAVLVFALDNPSSFHVLSQHLLDIVSFAENAKIFLCGNKSDSNCGVTDADMEFFCEQCHDLISATYKVSCKTGQGVQEMFDSIAEHLVKTNCSRLDLQAANQSFKIQNTNDQVSRDECSC